MGRNIRINEELKYHQIALRYFFIILAGKKRKDQLDLQQIPEKYRDGNEDFQRSARQQQSPQVSNVRIKKFKQIKLRDNSQRKKKFNHKDPQLQVQKGPQRRKRKHYPFLKQTVNGPIVYFLCVYVFAVGSPSNLVAPYDSDGQACGLDQTVAKYPYIYYATPDPAFLYRTVCVSECPSVPPPDQKSLKKVSKKLNCIPNSEITQCQEKQSKKYPQFNILIYDSLPYKNFCLPTDLATFKSIINSAVQSYMISKIYDITHCTSLIYILVLAVILINVAIVQNKYPMSPSLIVYGGISAYFISFSAILCLFIQKLLTLLAVENEKNPQGTLDEAGILLRIQTRTLTSGSLAVFCGFLGLILLVSFILLIIKRASVQRLIKILSETQKQIDKPLYQQNELQDRDWKVSLGLPLSTTVLSIINLYIIFQAILNAFSTNKITGSQQLPFDRYGFSLFTAIFLIILFFEFFWINSIIVGVVKYVYTNNFAVYFLLEEQQKDENKKTIQFKVIEKMMTFHLGSIIKGQPIINLCIAFRNCYKPSRKYRGEAFIENFFKSESFQQSCQIFENDIYNQHESDFNKSNFIGQTYSLLMSLTISFFCAGTFYVVLTVPQFGFQVSSPITASFIAMFFCYLITYLFQSSIGSFIDVISFLMILSDQETIEREGLSNLKDLLLPD